MSTLLLLFDVLLPLLTGEHHAKELKYRKLQSILSYHTTRLPTRSRITY